MLIDCHTHLDQYKPIELEAILQRALDADVRFIIAAGTTLASSEQCVSLSNSCPALLAGVGLHPMDLKGPVDDSTYLQLRQLAMQNPRVVTVSEIGLDFMEGAPERRLQDKVFREQIRLALDLRLPIIYHSRESNADVIKVLREEKAWEVGGAMHYFQGTEREALEGIELGFYISLAKPLLRLPALQEVARRLPLDKVVLETDSYPQPFKKNRERWTEPKDIAEVAQKLAQLKRLPIEDVAQATTTNAMRMLGAKALLLASD